MYFFFNLYYLRSTFDTSMFTFLEFLPNMCKPSKSELGHIRSFTSLYASTVPIPTPNKSIPEKAHQSSYSYRTFGGTFK